MNKFKQSAITILKEYNIPLHYKEITRLALEKGILETEGKTPESTMSSQLILDIRNKGKASDFIKTSPSTYALNTNKITLKNAKKIIEKEQQQDEKLNIEGGYTGKAGEHLVCSHLLFRGFNASIMSVDVGIDIIATIKEKVFGIQVKTSNLNSFNMYVFDIRKISFQRHNTSSIFYIFVLHGEVKDNFLILPVYEIEKMVEKKIILEVGHGKRYRVNISIREDQVYLGNRDNNMDYYLNNWKIIK